MSESIIREVALRVRSRIEAEIREQIAKEIEAKYCASSDDENDEPFIPDYENDLGCFGVNAEHCDIIKKCAAIARGEVKE